MVLDCVDWDHIAKSQICKWMFWKKYMNLLLFNNYLVLCTVLKWRVVVGARRMSPTGCPASVWALGTNVCFIKNRSKLISVLLLCLLRIFIKHKFCNLTDPAVNQTSPEGNAGHLFGIWICGCSLFYLLTYTAYVVHVLTTSWA